MNLGDILPFAIGVAISPVPIIAVILMLFSDKAKSNGLAFLVGWVGALLIAGGIVLTLANAGKISESGTPSTLSFVIKLLLGLLFLFLAFHNWQSRPKKGEEAEMPAWMAGIDSFTPGKALGMAALLAGVNPKNLGLTIAAAMVIVQAGVEGPQAWLLLLVFVVIASVTVGIPVLYYVFAGDSAEKTLDRWKAWLSANNNAVMVVLFVVIGFKLVGDGLAGLLG